MRLGRGAVAVAFLAGLGATGVLPAAAESLGLGWDGEVTDTAIEGGARIRGEQLVVPVRFEYRGPPGSTIASLTLELDPLDERCGEPTTVTQPFAGGDGGGGPVLDAPDDAGTGPAVAEWTFAVDPGCNGTYDLEVVAVADPRGPAEPGDTGTASDALRVERLELALVPPAPTDVTAEPGADRKVTVRWAAPPTWREAPPRDAIGYRVERAAGSGEFVPVGTVASDVTQFVDDDLVAAPPGSYRYQVVALRRTGARDPAESVPAEVATRLAPVGAAAPAAPTSTTAAPVAPRPAPAAGAAARSSGQPAAPAAAPQFDPGYSETLDYGQELGAPNAMPPADANFLDLQDEQPAGTGVLIPAAVAACVAVWAMHARHLVRRATPAV